MVIDDAGSLAVDAAGSFAVGAEGSFAVDGAGSLPSTGRGRCRRRGGVGLPSMRPVGRIAEGLFAAKVRRGVSR
jgi:hypothetical protein